MAANNTKARKKNRGLNRFIFPLTPKTHVRVTEGDKIWFRIPEDKITSVGGLAKRKRIIQYREYKENLTAHALEKQFKLPEWGAAIYFFLPIPVRWTKKKRRESHYMEHQQKPDLSNLLKAFEDGLLKKDETICHYAGLGKYWVDTLRPDGGLDPGWIEVHLDMPIWNPLTSSFTINKL